METQQQAAQIRLSRVAARASQDFHDHRLGNGNRAASLNELGQAMIDCAPGSPVILDPG
jgi:hypothetical protein